MPYAKPALSFAEQLSQLKERGLIFHNEPKALHRLQVISYFRLSGYWFPLLADKQNHTFKHDSFFETAFDIYKFDRELRLLILRELEKIEVAVRSLMINTLSINRGAFWYIDSANLSNPAKHANTLTKIREEHKRSDEEFIQSYNDKYADSLPLSWMMLEVSFFGILSSLYSNLIHGKDKREIAAYFGLSDKALASWLHSIVYLRNICAHHSRLWNREMRIQPIVPRNPHHPFLNTTTYLYPDLNRIMPLNNKAYFIL